MSGDMRKVTITRNKGWYGLIRGLKLFIDDNHVGTLGAGKTINVSIPNDAREFYGKMDGAYTNRLSLIGVKDGDHLLARAWFSFNPLQLLWAREIAIRIEVESSAGS